MEKNFNPNLLLFILGILLTLFLFFMQSFKQDIKKLHFLKNNIIANTFESSDSFVYMWGVKTNAHTF